MTMSKRIFHLACHCQANILRITYPESVKPFEKNAVCDCSFCLKRRTIWSIAPPGSGKVLKGMDQLKIYQFGPKTLYHQSCGICGSHLLSTFETPKIDLDQPTYFNLRNIRDDDFDLWSQPIQPVYVFAKQGTPYTHPTLADLPGAKEYLEKRVAESDKPSEILVGSCHCKAVQFAVVAEKLGTGPTNDCACSICLGNGSLWVYPARRDIFFSPSNPGKPHQPLASTVFEYGYYKKENLMWHCNICSCNLYEAESEELLEGEAQQQTLGLNIALLSNIGEWFDDVVGLSWNEEKRIEGYNGYKLSGKPEDGEEKLKDEREYKALKSLGRGREMKFRGPPHYTLDLKGLA